MKKEAIIFLIGLLVGAIISTGSILLYSTFTNSNNATPAMDQAPNGQGGGMQNGTTPPDKPTSNNTQVNN